MDNKTDDLILTDSQQRALDRIITFVKSPDSKVFILKGYAGTGKTTLVSTIIREIRKMRLSYSQ